MVVWFDIDSFYGLILIIIDRRLKCLDFVTRLFSMTQTKLFFLHTHLMLYQEKKLACAHQKSI